MSKHGLFAPVSIGLVALLALLHVAMPTWLGLFYLKLSGRLDCSSDALRRGGRYFDMSVSARDHWNRNSRLSMRDGNLELWTEGGASWWMPSSARPMVPWVMGEMAADFYGSADDSVRPGDVVLDCGADIGVFTRQALDRRASLVVAIEPHPDKEPCLRRNFESEIQQKRVIVVPKGVWDKESELEIYGDSLVERKSDYGIKVPLTTIDALVLSLRLPRVDYIKMDMEGAEPFAIRGAATTIRRWKPRITIATEHSPDDYVSLPKQIRQIERGYTSIRCNVCGLLFDKIRPVSLTMDAR